MQLLQLQLTPLVDFQSALVTIKILRHRQKKLFAADAPCGDIVEHLFKSTAKRVQPGLIYWQYISICILNAVQKQTKTLLR